MKKVLYLTNIETPYRVRFFNKLAQLCDLTVLYETNGSEDRNQQWAKSVQIMHRSRFLKRRGVFFSGILRWIRGGYDHIIVGCYNTPVQIFAMLVMRILGIPFIINLDGEPFLEGPGLKNWVKRVLLSWAEKYLVAGECAAASLAKVVGTKEIIPYYFSSLSENEINVNAHRNAARGDTVLVIGQYFDYKGMDVALRAARMDPMHNYQFVGMGSRTQLFLENYGEQIPKNVEIIPFLQKEELEQAYMSCAVLVLPSRQECWGLVINEAASFGTPIVSTWGSGAAVEFLSESYSRFLAKPGDPTDLLRCVNAFWSLDDKSQYSQYLRHKNCGYSVERSVQMHMKAFKPQ